MPPAQDFDAAYAGTPPWDIGRPQPAVAALADADAFHTPVLDAGCGTGENALLLASRGLDVVGVDASPRAIAQARRKAEARRLGARFLVADALNLHAVAQPFASVLDCGLFHVFDDADRSRYVASLAGVLDEGGIVHLLCFSDREPDWGGPRRVSQEEIRAAFAVGWDVETIAPARFVTNLEGGPAHAWLARIRRTRS